VDHISHGDAEDISTWDEMKEELCDNCNTQDETWDAQTKVRYIKQTESLQGYQWEFVSVIFELLFPLESS